MVKLTHLLGGTAIAAIVAVGVAAQNPPAPPPAPAIDPFPEPINATADIIRVGLTDFATLPARGNEAARMMLLVNEPGTRRMFINDQWGLLYSVSYDGKTVTPYLDLTDAKWGHPVQAMGRERGFQSFAFHPQFNQQGSRGYGKFYTYLDTTNQTPAPDFRPKGDMTTHDMVLLEWTARTPSAATYDGAAPRELMRFRHPFANHNGGMIGFNPLTAANAPDYGMLFIGSADGGNGGDPMNQAQDLSNGFGKIFRIDPLGNNSTNKKYGIPADNPFVADNNPQTLGEIWAYGVRNPQRFAWDSRTGSMFVSDIGQNIIEEVSLVPKGGNLGWNTWEASYRFISRTELRLNERRADPRVTYPLVEFDHKDALFPTGRSAISGLVIYRGNQIPQLANRVLFSDMPSGEAFYFSADRLPEGGQEPIRRLMFNSGGTAKNLLQVIREKRPNAERADLRFSAGPDNRVFVLNKADGVVREVTR